jgi:hypothetical protein
MQPKTAYYARPTSSFGYWRGGMSDGPLTQNQGSFHYGPSQQGAGLLPPGAGDPVAGTAWSATLTYLFVLIVVEIVAFGFLGRLLK